MRIASKENSKTKITSAPHPNTTNGLLKVKSIVIKEIMRFASRPWTTSATSILTLELYQSLIILGTMNGGSFGF